MSKRTVRDIIADLRKEETFANSEEYRHKYPNRELRPEIERYKYPDYYRESQKKQERER